MTKVLVIGGYSDVFSSYLDSVEAIDLSAEVSTCESVSNYPFSGFAFTGTLLAGVPTVCGGYNAETDSSTNECNQYNHEENRWVRMAEQLSRARQAHKSSMVDSAHWLISGGQDNGVELDTTDIWHDGEFQPGPFLPFPMRVHCQVTLNSSYVAILGGYNGTEYLRQFHLLDWKNAVWILMPDVPVNLSNDPCGLIENSDNGLEMVVLADYDSCYIFNFADMTWREGPNIPYDVKLSTEEMLVQMEKSFYIIGGNTVDGTATDSIFQFDNENYAWNLASSHLQTARRHGAAIAVPDETVNCG